MFDAAACLGDGSPLTGTLQGFRPRAAQLALADAVAACYSGDGHLLAEAATGVGKSLAYLVPAAFAGRRVVVSTYTKSLQDQLLAKDLPLARIASGRPLTAAVVKGRASYVCRAQLAVVEGRLDIDGAHGLARLRPWLAATRHGDRDELDHVPSAELWRELSVGPERCRGRRCGFVETCFSELARRRALDADVVLVNHALYMADLALRSASVGSVSILPEHDLVVFDEAHTLRDVAAEWLGVRLSHATLARFGRDVERAADSARAEAPAAAVRALLLHAARFFGALPGEPRRRLRDRELAALPHDSAAGMRQALAEVASRLRGRGEEADAMAKQAEVLAVAVGAVLEPDHDATVVWSERDGRDVQLRTAPIDVAPQLAEHLFGAIEGAALLSATLALHDGFRHVRATLGIPSARELRLPSPFDVERNALLCVPRDAPATGGTHGASPAALAELMERLVRASDGRALLLFSSYRQLHAVHALLAPRLPYTCLRQGEAPRERLLERFRGDVTSVLCATTSFWQGIDVPGEALSLVVIDKLPFASPEEPLVSARSEAAERDGRSGFAEVQLPRAAMLLKQGFGRLLRSEDDRGVVAILDRRLLTRPYGAALLAALPPVARTQDVDDVRAFFAVAARQQVDCV
jgi:ATP-dependent DNA helicase DinG